jgi:hypothetical protein
LNSRITHNNLTLTRSGNNLFSLCIFSENRRGDVLARLSNLVSANRCYFLSSFFSIASFFRFLPAR